MSSQEVRTTDAVAVRHLSVTFAGQRALNDVSFGVRRGSITALLGMNGSGKSTLIKVLAGIYRPDDGSEVDIAGEPAPLPLTPRTAHAGGLRFLHQDVGLVGDLTVSDNFAFSDTFRLGKLGAIDRRRQEDHVQESLERFDLGVSPRALIRDLTPTQRTMIGVARAFQHDEATGEAAFARNVLVLDEPTASLPAEEVDSVLATVEELRRQGGTIIYVSHRTDEVKRLADQLVILRDGKLVADEPATDLTVDEIVTRVIGHRIERNTRTARVTAAGQTVVAARGLTGNRLRSVDIEIREGEILGIAGLVGCGRSELVRILAGEQRRASGSIELGGRDFDPKSPSDAIADGVVCVPQDRRRDGVVLPMNVRENLTLGRMRGLTRGIYLSAKREQQRTAGLISSFTIKPPNPAQIVGLLSGGNQQKVVVARAASQKNRVVLLDEPTQGVDALAKSEIADIIRGLAAGGAAVLVASSDSDELVGLCDRVVVLDRGHVAIEVSGNGLTEERLAALCAQSSQIPPVDPANKERQ
ncbi:MAG TPA: sugar ABC transporter ATP-binding protein [Pseudolysinimonas sp.]|nr:sugar ABC transporter ATP-binding protein [Pseudolysinimonas sp.]